MQTSDRRITLADGSVGGDMFNKAVLVGRESAIAYTGLAYCDGRHPTDELVLDALQATLKLGQDPLERLRVDATHAVKLLRRKLPPSTRNSITRTSFVAVGFANSEKSVVRDRSGGDSLIPFLSVVSNAQTVHSEAWDPEANRQFSATSISLGPGEMFKLHVAGQSVSPKIRTQLHRQLRDCIDRCEHPESSARLLTRAIRAVASINPAVGSGAMNVLVRRSEAGKEFAGEFSGPVLPVNGHESIEIDYFKHARGDQPPSPWIFSPSPGGAFTHFGPAWVTPEMQLRDMVVGVAGPETEDAQLQLEEYRAGRLRSR